MSFKFSKVLTFALLILLLMLLHLSAVASEAVVTTNNPSLCKEYSIDKLNNDSYSTRYTAANSVEGAYSPTWIQFDFGVETKINKLSLCEYTGSIKSFMIQCSNDGSAWQTISENTKGTDSFFMATFINFDAITARYFRLSVTEAVAPPSIYSLRFTLDETAESISNGKICESNSSLKTFEASKANDGSMETRWASQVCPTDADNAVWLSIDLGTVKQFNYAAFYEFSPRVRDFYIQYSNDNVNWRSAFHGTGLSQNDDYSTKCSFDEVSARYVRLLILNAEYGPTIYEFNVQRRKPFPSATDISIERIMPFSDSIKGSYRYYSPVAADEGATVMSWYASNTKNGAYTKIGEGNQLKLEKELFGQYVKFGVLSSDETGAVDEAERVSEPMLVPESSFQGTVMMKLDCPRVYTGSGVTYFDSDNRKLTPRMIDGKIFIPLRFVCEQLGAQVVWSEESISVSCGGKTTVYETTEDSLPLIWGSTYINPCKVAAAVGCNVYYDTDNGGILFCNEATVRNVDKEAFADGLSILEYGYSRNEVKTAAESFFALIDLDKEEMSEIKEQYQAGNFGSALSLFENYYIDLLEQRYITAPEDWVNISSAQEVMDNYIKISHPGGSFEYDIGKPGNITWYKKVDTDYRGFFVHMAAMHFPRPLITEFCNTGDIAYMEKWSAIWDDFVTNNFEQWMATRFSDEAEFHDSLPVEWTQQLYLSWKVENFSRQLGTAAHYAPELVKQAVSPVSLAKMLTCMDDYVLKRLVTMLSGVPNQIFKQAQEMLMVSATMEAFKNGSFYYDTSTAVLDAYLNGSANMPDGTDFEQSFSYNEMLVERAKQVKEIYKNLSDKPDFYDKLDDISTYRLRMLTASKNPLGTGPGVRNGGFSVVPYKPDYMLDIFKNNINGGAELSFESIAFPYGGYYVMRKNWVGENAVHMFMKASRRGNGHLDEAGNGLQLTAYGRYLLYDGGAGNYSTDFYENYVFSSFAHNTVIVDGLSQVMTAEPPRSKAFDATIESRWLAGSGYDFMEGEFPYGYGILTDTNNAKKVIDDVTHNRQVIYDRDTDLFFVTDKLISSKQHTYTQLWTLNESFDYSTVSIMPENKLIRTTDPDGANISIYNLTDKQLTYNSFRGVNDDGTVLGWVHAGNGTLFPKIDNHISWTGTGNQIMTTLLSPRRTTEETVASLQIIPTGDASLSQVSVTLYDGTVILFGNTVGAAKTINLGDIRINGEALLVKTTVNGEISGIALGCKSLTLNKVLQHTDCENFEFNVTNGKINTVNKIEIPQTFKWVQSGDGYVPVYKEVE